MHDHAGTTWLSKERVEELVRMLAVVMGLLGGFLPAVRAARVSPIDAMRG